VPEVIALPLTFPAVEIVAREESGREAMAVVSAMGALPSKFTPVAVTAPVREMARGVAVLVAVSEFPTTAPVWVPAVLAVIVPATKFPEASRATMALAVFRFVAVVALLATLPAVEIVANFVSTMAAAASMSALMIPEIVAEPARLFSLEGVTVSLLTKVYPEDIVAMA
jgi:hypothetical protein